MYVVQNIRDSFTNRQFFGRWTVAEAGRYWLSAVPYLLLTLLVGRIVWLGTLNEDSFISYRCLENLMHGLGMTWHVDLRSQPYTHPLWMLLHIPLRIVIPDVKIVSYMISFACLGGVLWCLHRNYSGWKPIYSLLVLTPLLLSKCFTEYGTSGLENPVAHLMAVLFFTGFLGGRRKNFDMDQAAFLAAVAFLNRQDHALFYAIPIALMWIQRRQYRADTISLVIAALPVAAWFAFAVFYYGSALPDTYYAKLTAGIDKDLLAAQGVSALGRFLELDTASFLVIVVAIVAAAAVMAKTVVPCDTRQRFAAAAVSVLLFLTYFIYAGGDYMVGRFFSTPLVISVVLLAESLRVLEQGTPSADAKNEWLTSGRRESLLWLAFVAAFFIPLAMPDFVLGKPAKPTIWKFGGLDMQQHPWNFRLRSWRIPEGCEATGMAAIRNSLAVPEDETDIHWNSSAGIHAFCSGPSYGMIDPYGLVDPLLCRLPAEGYNPGHYFRKTPAGYEHARRTGDTSLMNPHLREYYEKLRFVRNAPLFSPERIGAAISYARGADDHLTREYVADMASDPEHKNDFWITRLTRNDRLIQLSLTKDFRGPFVAWYARMLSGNEESKQP
jgi:arabinofuranosyltransferase